MNQARWKLHTKNTTFSRVILFFVYRPQFQAWGRNRQIVRLRRSSTISSKTSQNGALVTCKHNISSKHWQYV